MCAKRDVRGGEFMSEKGKAGIANRIMAVAPKIFGAIIILCAVFLCAGS